MLPIIEFNTHPAYEAFCDTFTPEQRIYMVREYRNMLLVQSDFSQLPDSPVDKTVWAEYRQQLRDALDGYDGTSTEVIFPKPPKV